jgi:sec-independent protein translocase protein TatA
VTLAFLSAPGPMEMMVIGVIAVLLFGKRLPEVGRSLGKSIIEFKKGLKGIEDEFHAATAGVMDTRDTASTPAVQRDTIDHHETSAPKFEPPPSDDLSPESSVSAAPSVVPSASEAG